MLIQALSDYYDILAKAGKVLPEGYSNVKIHYIVSLTKEGEIADIIDAQKTEEVPAGKGKTKLKKFPREMEMPQRTQKPGIDANIAEHRPLYIFGLNMEQDALTPEDRTNKARKSHEAFLEKNLKFTEGLSSPVVLAYRRFLQTWMPEDEAENEKLLSLGKAYGSSGFAFCLTGFSDGLLHDDPQFREKWERYYAEESQKPEGSACEAQCAVTGKKEPIARIHDKIKGVYGGLATGTVLVGFNNPSENSYGNEQSFNSNISEKVMKKYTETLNYLLASSRHRVFMDDMTIVFWAMNAEEGCEEKVMSMLWGLQETMDAEETQDMLMRLMRDAAAGKVLENRLQSLDKIDKNVDFYMAGLKANSSRLSVKFVIRKKYADILWNIARFQNDLRIMENFRPVNISWIEKELKSPKSKNEKVNPAVLSKLFESVVYGYKYPVAILETIVRRIKLDGGDEDIKKKWLRAGLVKACINRNYPKEELKVALDRENMDQAYLCGRLFAVLERIQQEASKNSLNRTIKDAYFSSATVKPSLVFPKITRLSQNHLRKLTPSRCRYFNILTGQIMEGLQGEFPDYLQLKEQGKFIVGYYHQYQSFFEKNKEVEEN